MSYCPVKPARANFAYSRSHDVDWFPGGVPVGITTIPQLESLVRYLVALFTVKSGLLMDLLLPARS